MYLTRGYDVGLSVYLMHIIKPERDLLDVFLFIKARYSTTRDVDARFALHSFFDLEWQHNLDAKPAAKIYNNQRI